MSTLMIVESPHKAQEIGKYLGGDYVVMASYGHIRDLPPNGEEDGEVVVGVGRDLSARYEIGERSHSTVAKLSEAAKRATRVVLATDPDREGEAIAWHLQEVLHLRNPQRVTYQEVTAKAVKAALAQPRSINLDQVHAQEARRVLDRIVGYSVSPILSHQSGEKLSAGRVQSPAVRLVVEREREIRGFTQRQYFGVELGFAGGWKALWTVKPHLAPGQELWTDGEAATEVAGIRRLVVLAFSNAKANEAPSAPFTTSTLQQAASKCLGLKVKETMAAAQALFDGGHISYHRTDSPNYSEDTMDAIRVYAEGAGLPVAQQRRTWKARSAAQEGHEAIRPVNIEMDDAGGTKTQRQLYRLIRARALASQLSDAIYATSRVQLRAIDTPLVNGVVPEFEAKGRRLIHQGWRVVYMANFHEDDGEEVENELNNPIPELAVGTALTAETGRSLDKKTAAPKRFDEADLVRELEARGIGRPSTYASIIANIQARSYVIEEGDKRKYLVPTKTGEAIVDALVGHCRFMDYDFTASIEEELDLVAAGNRPYSAVVETAWRQLESELPGLKMASSNGLERACPDCGKALHRRNGVKGFFWGCTGYPDCKMTLPDNRGRPGERKVAAQPSTFVCPKCGQLLVHRQGRSKTKKGKKAREYDFYGCTGFPQGCDAAYRISPDGTPLLHDTYKQTQDPDDDPSGQAARPMPG